MEHNHSNYLKVKSIGIDTYRENIIYRRMTFMFAFRKGFTALTREAVRHKGKGIIATLNVIRNNDLLNHGEAALSMEAMQRLKSS